MRSVPCGSHSPSLPPGVHSLFARLSLLSRLISSLHSTAQKNHELEGIRYGENMTD